MGEEYIVNFSLPLPKSRGYVINGFFDVYSGFIIYFYVF